LFTNVDDLCKWVINFDQQITAKNPVYLRMLETIPLNNGDKNTYAFGLSHGEDGGLKTVSHTGGWAGYRTVILNFPDEKLSIILLGNHADFNSYGSALDVAKYILKNKFKATTNDNRGEKIKEQPTIKFNEAVAKKQEGTYQLGEEWYVTLTLENGVLMTQANGEDKFSTLSKSDSTIWIDAYGSAMTFIKDKSGTFNSLRYHGFIAPKITVAKPDLSKLNACTGTYYSEEFETEYKIDYVNNKLMMHHMRLGDFELSPNFIVSNVFYCNIGRIVFSSENGKMTGFRLSRGRVKNIKFDKK
jgi:hypothetical protein